MELPRGWLQIACHNSNSFAQNDGISEHGLDNVVPGASLVVENFHPPENYLFLMST